MDILKFFKVIGKAFEKAGKYLVRFISDAEIDFATAIVKAAAEKYVTGQDRRNWAIGQIKAQFPALPESVIRWLIETAVMKLKAEGEELIDKAADKAKDANDPPFVP